MKVKSFIHIGIVWSFEKALENFQLSIFARQSKSSILRQSMPFFQQKTVYHFSGIFKSIFVSKFKQSRAKQWP